MGGKHIGSAIDGNITQAELLELFEYNPDTGSLINLTRRSHRIKVGEEAGTLRQDGYIGIQVNNMFTMAHRIIWCMVHGAFPEHELDHINHVRNDNRLCNLKEATSKENLRNQKKRYDNASGTTGVYWVPSRKRWVAYITVDYVKRNLGRYKDIEDAIAARAAAENEHGFHKNHGGA